MMKLFLIILLFLVVAVALLAVKLFFGKSFVNSHVDGNKALRKKGIHCVQSMDAMERKENPHIVKEHNKTINKKL